MLFKLAAGNVKRQAGSYLIYFMTVSLTVSLLFAVSHVIFGEQMKRCLQTAEDLKPALTGAVVFICLIAAFVLSYGTSFMLKLRRREFGMYLMLGMSRTHILILFTAETMFICILALGIGLFFGIFLYQGLMAVIMHILEMEFTLSAYSVQGLLFTAVLVGGMFLLSSVTSACYLKKAGIYELLHIKSQPETPVRHPVFWLFLSIAALSFIISCCFLLNQELEAIVLNGASSESLTHLMLASAAGVVLFHIGLSRSFVYLMLAQKHFCSRGTNTFVLRQLSGALKKNSVLNGFLAVLLTFAVIGIQVSFFQKTVENASLNQNYPFDILYCSDRQESGPQAGEGIPLSKAEQIISSYVPVRAKLPFTIYTSKSSQLHSFTKWSGEGYSGLTDSYIRESDFNAIMTALGKETVSLNDEFIIIANSPQAAQFHWEDAVISRNGHTLHYQGTQTDCPRFHYVYFLAVIPDKAAAGMEIQTEYTAYSLKNQAYDAVSLKKDLSYYNKEAFYKEGAPETERYYERCDFTIREYGRMQKNGTAAVLTTGTLFAASVFLFMAMAILALKTLSGITEDKKRYWILFQIGLEERAQNRTLFRQTFSFFLMPFIFSILTSIPAALLCAKAARLGGFERLTGEIYAIAGMTALVMALVYLFYYTAAYLIMKAQLYSGRMS